MSEQQQSLQIFAPAKVNLFLQVTGKRADGYHALDSLITFADVGDVITIGPMEGFAFNIEGPYAGSFGAREKVATPDSKNLVVKAVWTLARMVNRSPSFSITLGKNIPLGAGLGGGSADAAAVLWGLCRYWNIAPEMDILQDLMMQLGADVPVCFESQTRFIAGAGEKLSAPLELPEIYAVIINPGQPCATKTVFQNFAGTFSVPADRPSSFQDQETLFDYLKTTRNDLLPAALKVVPQIQNCLNQLENSDGCAVARMSGSGSSCFGLYKSEKEAEAACTSIKDTNPDWWVRSTILGQIERY